MKVTSSMDRHIAMVITGFALASITGILNLAFYGESARLGAELDKAVQDNTMLRQELDGAMQELSSTKAELESSREALDSARSTIKSISDELDGTRQRLSAVEGELDRSRRDLADARDELDRTRARLLQTEAELSRSREEHKNTLRTLEEIRRDYDALKARLGEVEGNLKEYTYREDKGDFNVRYDSDGYRDTIDPMVAMLNSRLKLPYDIPLIVSGCGDVWYAAYVEYEVYTRKVNKMVFCAEALDQISELVDALYANGIASSKHDAFRVFTKYILYHEVGHVVIRIADLHTGSREESLVDDFAFYMLLKDGEDEDVDLLIWLYSVLARLEEQGEIDARHPSSPYLTYRQQYHDISCLAHGAGIESEHADIGERDESKCSIIWYEVSRGWGRALSLWWK